MFGLKNTRKTFEYACFTLNQARKMHLIVFGNYGEPVRCGETGHDTRTDKLRIQNGNATFRSRSLDVLCSLIRKGQEERPLEVVSRTDGLMATMH